MTYKQLFDAQHEYCQTEDYPGLAIRPHAFIAGAKWVIKCLSTIPVDEVVDEVVELYEELKQEEIKELKKQVGYERIMMQYNPETGNVKAVIEGKQYLDVKKIAENDGLKWDDFIDWFFGQGTNRTLFQGVIVHFTDFRYNNQECK